MDLQPSQSEVGKREVIDALIRHALLLDLEVSHQGAILKLGAIIGGLTLGRSGRGSFEGIIKDLDRMAEGANCVLGHNLFLHDLPVLRERAFNLTIHRLPVVDTLILSPICFPENPYHRLVKDYKLVRESVNDPVADARQAAVLFSDEFRALDGLRQTEPKLFELLDFLLTTPDQPGETLPRGMDLVFRALGGVRPATARALEICTEMFGRWGCASVPVDQNLVQSASQRLSLAYAVTWLRVAGSNSVLPPWVRLQHPATGELIRRLREIPCGSEN